MFFIPILEADISEFMANLGYLVSSLSKINKIVNDILC